MNGRNDVLACGWGLVCGWALSTVALGQNQAAVPHPLTNVPGNAGISIPFRWERGMLQCIYQRGMLPPDLGGKTISALTFRRTVLEGEPAYTPITRTLRVWLANTPRPACTNNMDGNFPLSAIEVVPPTSFTSVATQPRGVADAAGQEMLTIPLATPFLVGSSNLFLQVEVLAPAFAVGPEQWADALWINGGADPAYIAEVGGGGCSTTAGATPRLRFTGANVPTPGNAIALELTDARPSEPVFLFLGPEPEVSPTVPTLSPGFGQPLGAFGPSGCYAWVEPDTFDSKTTNAAGVATWSLTTPTSLTGGLTFGFQAFQIDPTLRPQLVVMASNGVVFRTEPAGLGPAVSSAFSIENEVFPDPQINGPRGLTATFPPLPGVAPVVTLTYQ